MASHAYRLKAGESVPSGVARIARGRIDHALEELRGESSSTPEEAVHEARKDMKKLRALLRLVRGEVGDRTYRRENACFRDVARELAGMRDADVMLATLAELERRESLAAGPLRQALEAHRLRTGAGRQAVAGAIEMLGTARDRVAAWPLERDSFEAFEAGLERAYRRGRRAFREVRERPTIEGLHEWRKRVKELWHHLGLLERAWPPVLGAMGAEAHELSDRLGDDHDLAVLLAWAGEHAPEVAGLDEAVERERARLQREALELGARLYADRPRAFVRRKRRWWRAEALAAERLALPHSGG